MKKQILFISYGCGHSNSLIPIAKLLNSNKDLEVNAIGLTLAKNDYLKAGINTLSSSDILEESALKYQDIIEKYLPTEKNPNIEEIDTQAYYLTGFADLVENFGYFEAEKKISKYNRYCFYPINFARRYLVKNKPDLLITSICPRSELAFNNAAHELGIESIAISDVFVIDEEEYVCKENYAKNLTVISEAVKERLLKNGCKSKIYVLGNPAFDNLLNENKKTKKEVIKKKFGLNEKKKTILWAMSEYDKFGNSLESENENNTRFKFIDVLNLLSSSALSNNYEFILRTSPKSEYNIKDKVFSNGIICPKNLSVKEAFDISDIVLVEFSTVGLEAFIYGLPVIQLGYRKSAPYGKLKIAKQVFDLNGLKTLLSNLKDINYHQGYSYPKGNSAKKISDLCLNLLKN